MVIFRHWRAKDPEQATVLTTTSWSKEAWSRELSPFFLGPITLWDGRGAQRMENAWQYSKVYSDHLGSDGKPNADWFEWSSKGFADTKAHRRPMGRRKPEFAWWDNEPLGYIEARKRIYLPLYAAVVVQTGAFRQLRRLYEAEGTICLKEFDVCDMEKHYPDETDRFTSALNNPGKIFGHSYILGMLLEQHPLVAEYQSEEESQ